MADYEEMTVTERLQKLLQHLGIARAHFASRSLGDLTGLAAERPEMCASLTLLCPATPPAETVTQLAPRLLVFRGDREVYDQLGELIGSLPAASLVTLQDEMAWSDLVARHEEEIESALLPFLAAQEQPPRPDGPLHDGERGVVAGVSYHVQGSGPPLILMPIGFSASQWEPIVPRLAQHYATITLGGRELGIVSLLEKRATLAGYLDMFDSLVRHADLQPGDAVLEVGCGTGALSRRLAHETKGMNPTVGVDINHYFLREAAGLALAEGVDGAVQFREGDATELPFPDNQFQLTIAVTVLEEVDADASLSEMIRVTSPGGAVAVIVRAKDIPTFVNLDVGETLKAKLEHPSAHGGDAAPAGCADAGLYARFEASPLTVVKKYPCLAAFNEQWALAYFPRAVAHLLSKEENEELQAACDRAKEDGTFVWGYPHHCAVGRKPS